MCCTYCVYAEGTFEHSQRSASGFSPGCALPPLLFNLHTNTCQSRCENRILIKYADDSVTVSALCDTARSLTSVYRDVRSRTYRKIYPKLTTKGAQSYKYLRIISGDKQIFGASCEAVCKKVSPGFALFKNQNLFSPFPWCDGSVACL